MDVFIVYKEDYPWDVRVEKIALSLSKAGHNVTIISQNLSQDLPTEANINFKIARLPQFNKFPKFLVRLLNLALWFNPIWLYSLLKYTKNSSSPIIIVRDLPLVKAGILVAKFRNAKIIYDMAEVYPEMYASSNQYGNRSLLTKIFKNPSLAIRYEKSVLKDLDNTLVMIEESRDRLLRMGISSDRVTIVSNTPPIDKFSGKITHHYGVNLNIVYVGFVTGLRGLDLLVLGIDEFIKNGGDRNSIKLDIVGKGAARQGLVDLVEKLNLSDVVDIHGWLEQSEVDELLSKANIGALTYRVCGHWNHTIPNKIFDYMLAGLPVLATPVIPIKRILQNENCGLVAESASPQAIAKCLAQLQDSKTRQLLGENGHRSVMEKYSWDKDEAKLLQCIERVQTSGELSSKAQESP